MYSIEGAGKQEGLFDHKSFQELIFACDSVGCCLRHAFP